MRNNAGKNCRSRYPFIVRAEKGTDTLVACAFILPWNLVRGGKSKKVVWNGILEWNPKVRNGLARWQIYSHKWTRIIARTTKECRVPLHVFDARIADATFPCRVAVGLEVGSPQCVSMLQCLGYFETIVLMITPTCSGIHCSAIATRITKCSSGCRTGHKPHTVAFEKLNESPLWTRVYGDEVTNAREVRNIKIEARRCNQFWTFKDLIFNFRPIIWRVGRHQSKYCT